VLAYYSVFEFTFSGCWPTYARPLVEEVSNWYALFFMSYVICVIFTLFRIITAIFLKDTMALAAKDADLAVQQQMHQKAEFARDLKSFFEAADTSGDGMISKEEFDDILSDEKIKTWLNMLELSLHDISELFHILSGGDCMLSYDEFTKGIIQMRGAARSEDVIAIKRQGNKLGSNLDTVLSSLAKATAEMKILRESVDDLGMKIQMAI